MTPMVFLCVVAAKPNRGVRSHVSTARGVPRKKIHDTAPIRTSASTKPSRGDMTIAIDASRKPDQTTASNSDFAPAEHRASPYAGEIGANIDAEREQQMASSDTTDIGWPLGRTASSLGSMGPPGSQVPSPKIRQTRITHH